MNLREKIMKYIEDTLGEVSPETVTIYRNKIKEMTKDEDIIEYFKHAKLRLYVDDKKIDSNKIDNLVKKMNVISQERITLPHQGPDVISKFEAMVFPVQIRRLQQLATKESHSELEIESRNKAGQADGGSKTGKITDAEVNQLVALGMDRVLTELMSPRSDNNRGKRIMNDSISRGLSFSLNSVPDDPNDKNTLLYIDSMYKCMGLATDFIDDFDLISY